MVTGIWMLLLEYEPRSLLVGGLIPANEVSVAPEMHFPTIQNTKLTLSWNLFCPPLGIEPQSPRLVANHSSHKTTKRKLYFYIY